MTGSLKWTLRSGSGVIVAAGPGGPEAHVIAGLDDDAPVVAVFLRRLRDEAELDAEAFELEGGDADALVLEAAQGSEEVVAAGFALGVVHGGAGAEVVDRRREEGAGLVEEVKGDELAAGGGAGGVGGDE